MNEFYFSEENFSYFKELGLKRIGIVLNNNKKEAVYNRFVKRLTLFISFLTLIY